jgi:hypothetical protein
MSPAVKKQLAASLKLATIFANAKGKQLVPEVTQAFESPAEYVKHHAAALRKRNVTGPSPLLPWLAVIDGLGRAKCCAGIDWKSRAQDVALAIHALGGPKKPKWLKDGSLHDRSTWEILELAGKELKASGKQLASLDTASDEYNLVMFGRKKLVEVKKLVKQAGQQVEFFDGSQLGAATAQRKERDAAKPTPPPPPEIAPTVFGRRGESRTLRVAQTGLTIERQSKKVNEITMHVFPDAARTAAFAKGLVEGWLDEGYRPISGLEAKRYPKHSGDFVGPFAADARYFIEKRGKLKIVRGWALRGDTVWSAMGIVGSSFGELVNMVTHASIHDAEMGLAHALETAAAFQWEAIDLGKVKRLFR